MVLEAKAIEICEAKNIHDLGEAGHSPRIKALLSQPWLNVRNMQYSLLNGRLMARNIYLAFSWSKEKKRNKDLYSYIMWHEKNGKGRENVIKH